MVLCCRIYTLAIPCPTLLLATPHSTPTPAPPTQIKLEQLIPVMELKGMTKKEQAEVSVALGFAKPSSGAGAFSVASMVGAASVVQAALGGSSGASSGAGGGGSSGTAAAPASVAGGGSAAASGAAPGAAAEGGMSKIGKG